MIVVNNIKSKSYFIKNKKYQFIFADNERFSLRKEHSISYRFKVIIKIISYKLFVEDKKFALEFAIPLKDRPKINF